MNKEFDFVKRLVSGAPRSPLQKNTFYQSDAEVLKVGPHYLCASVDTIAEEINMGLIQDSKSLGWLSAIVSFSDLAAIGVKAQKLSITRISTSPHLVVNEPEFLAGVQEACKTYDVQLDEYQILPGQINLVSSTAAAISAEEPMLARVPLKVGDQLYLTGPLGLGNVVAFANVALRAKAPEIADHLDRTYRPVARSEEVQLIKKFAHACIDTSDGGLFSFELLASLNAVGIEIDYHKNLMHPAAFQVGQQAQVNPFIFFAAQNGEFELIFAVSKEKELEFLESCRNQNRSFIKAGRVVAGNGLALNYKNQTVRLDMSSIQNMLYDRTSAEQYILGLIKFAAAHQIGAF